MTARATIAWMLVAVAFAAVARSGQAGMRLAILAPDGIGSVHFGLTKPQAMARLSALFGAPTARGINTGCGPRYTEVEWGDLVAEFRSSTFSGYRYITGGYPITTSGSPREPSPPKTPSPALATARGISLGSTLARLRRAYTGLRSIGTDRWRSPSGLVFVDNAEHDPEPSTSRLVEIRIGTCGDF